MQFYLAPMEGLTGYVYRSAYHKYFPAADRYFTPFITNKKMSSRERNDILPEHNEGMTVIPQILTNQAEDFLSLTKELKEYSYDTVNLNLGCPSGTVVAKRRGSGLLAWPHTLDAFLDEVFSSCDCRISIKTRLGTTDTDEWETLLAIYDKYPLEELIIHPRVREDFYSGTPRLDAFSRAYEVRKAPLCYNGDIFTVEDLKRIEREFPQITAVMIGRGVLRHPGLTGQLHGKDLPEKSVWEAFAGQLRDEYVRISINEEKALFKLKEIWSYLRWSFPESNIWDRQMKVAGDLETFFYGMRNLLDTYDPEKIPEKRGIPGLHNS